MPYQLRDDLSFCRVGSQLVFLDVREDRYFLLPSAMERAFTAYLDSREAKGKAFAELVRKNILIKASTAGGGANAPIIERAYRSAIEDDHATPRVSLRTCLEVFAIVCATAWQLKTRKLKSILDRLLAYRDEKMRPSLTGVDESQEGQLVSAACAFRHARLYVPVGTSCLLDSLSLTRFLSRRQLPANVVIGVTLDPFSAHCWVQAGDLALNETISDANAYTPIRVI